MSNLETKPTNSEEPYQPPAPVTSEKSRGSSLFLGMAIGAVVLMLGGVIAYGMLTKVAPEIIRFSDIGRGPRPMVEPDHAEASAESIDAEEDIGFAQEIPTPVN